MTETIRYTPIGRQDIRFGTSTYEVTLADGRVVTLDEVNVLDLITDYFSSTNTFRIVDSNDTLIHSFGTAT
jgi:hypothetical protein